MTYWAQITRTYIPAVGTSAAYPSVSPVYLHGGYDQAVIALMECTTISIRAIGAGSSTSIGC